MTRSSIKRKLTLIGWATSGVALLSAGALLGGHAWLESRQQLLDRLEVTARVVGGNCTAALAFDDRAAAGEILGALGGAPGVVRAVLYDKLGRPFAEYRGAGVEGAIPPPQPQPRARWIRSGRAAVFGTVLLDGEPIGILYLEAGTREIDARLARQVGIMGLIVAASLLLAHLLLARLQSAITRPVLDLSRLMKSVVDTRDYSARARVDRDDELGVLAAGFNEMLHDMQRRDAALESHRRSLEDEVARRTAELAAANRLLTAELAERERAEKVIEEAAQAIEEAAHHWRTTFDAIGDAVCLLDTEHRLVQGNRALVDLLGTRWECILGRHIDELLAPVLDGPPPSWGPEDHRKAKRAGESGGRWFELRRDPVRSESGELVGYVQLVSDISEQRRLQEQLSQAQKMEAIGRLAGGVAHDFNNLLSVILAFSDLLVEALPADGKLRSHAQDIKRAGERAAALTRQLLTFGRKRVLMPGIVKVDRIAANVSKMIGRLIGEQIELTLSVGAGVGCVYMDPSELEQVLMNLAVNARDAMPQGGKLTIEIRDVEVTPGEARQRLGVKSGSYVKIRVSDTGTGMSPETAKRIFEPFFTTKPPGKGTGLGLAIVYGAVEQSGGHIDVASELGRGTSFSIHLPRVQAAAPVEPPPPATAPRGEGELILLVEDDAQVRRAVRLILEGSGYRVVEATDGEHGIAQFTASSLPISLVLTDVVMPGIGGLAMARGLRAKSTDLPILYMTGYSEAVASGTELLPEDQVLTKPFEPARLLTQVRSKLARTTMSAAEAEHGREARQG